MSASSQTILTTLLSRNKYLWVYQLFVWVCWLLLLLLLTEIGNEKCSRVDAPAVKNNYGSRISIRNQFSKRQPVTLGDSRRCIHYWSRLNVFVVFPAIELNCKIFAFLISSHAIEALSIFNWLSIKGDGNINTDANNNYPAIMRLVSSHPPRQRPSVFLDTLIPIAVSMDAEQEHALSTAQSSSSFICSLLFGRGCVRCALFVCNFPRKSNWPRKLSSFELLCFFFIFLCYWFSFCAYSNFAILRCL